MKSWLKIKFIFFLNLISIIKVNVFKKLLSGLIHHFYLKSLLTNVAR